MDPTARKFALLSLIHALIGQLVALGEPFPDMPISGLSTPELEDMARDLRRKVEDAIGL